MKVIVLSKKDYEFTNKDTGELVKGASVQYLIENGIEPIKLSLNTYQNNLSLSEKITSVPSICDFELETTVKAGQLVQFVKDIKFVKNVDLFKEVN